MDGRRFAMKQIVAAINAFAPVLKDELDTFRQLLLTCEANDDDDETSFLMLLTICVLQGWTLLL